MGKQLRILLDEVQLSPNLLTREAFSMVADILFELRAKVHQDVTAPGGPDIENISLRLLFLGINASINHPSSYPRTPPSAPGFSRSPLSEKDAESI